MNIYINIYNILRRRTRLVVLYDEYPTVIYYIIIIIVIISLLQKLVIRFHPVRSARALTFIVAVDYFTSSPPPRPTSPGIPSNDLQLPLRRGAPQQEIFIFRPIVALYAPPPPPPPLSQPLPPLLPPLPPTPPSPYYHLDFHHHHDDNHHYGYTSTTVVILNHLSSTPYTRTAW